VRLFLFIFIVLTYSFAGFPKGEGDVVKNHIYVDFTKAQDLNDQEIQFIRKSAFEVIFVSKAFKLLLHESDMQNQSTKQAVYKIETIIFEEDPDTSLYSIDFFLIDTKNNLFLHKIHESHVAKSKVQFRARVMLFKLIFGKNFDEKNNQLLKSEISPSLLSPGIKNDRNNLNQESPNYIQKFYQELMNQFNRRKNSQPVQPTPTPPAKSPEADTVLRKYKEDRVNISNFASPNLNLARNTPSEAESTKNRLNLVSNYNFGVGYNSDSFTSKALIETQSEVKRYIIDLGINFKAPKSDRFTSINASYSQIVGDDDYKIGPIYSLQSTYNFNLGWESLFIGPALEYQSFSFVNLGERGTDLQTWSNNIIWMGARMLLILPIRSSKLIVNLDFYKTAHASTNFKDKQGSIPLNGDKTYYAVSYVFWKNFGLKVFKTDISLYSFSDTNLSNHHSQYGLCFTFL